MSEEQKDRTQAPGPLSEYEEPKESDFVFDETAFYGRYAEIVINAYPVDTVDSGALYHIVGFDKWCDEVVALAKKWLQRDIDKYIPLKYHKRIQWIVRQPGVGPVDPLLVNGSVGWKYTPEPKVE